MLSSSKKEKQKGKLGQSQSHQILKPFLNKRFYLDIKSHIVSKNLEERLKNLGAVVEIFLVKEVNCVVTDRPQWSGAPLSGSGSTPKCFAQPSPSLTPLGPCSNESPVALDSPGDGLGGGGSGRCRTKSRAEAMLERARLQPQQNTVDPLENASRWNIPVWPLEKVNKWLDKITEKLHKYNKTQGSGSKGLVSFKAPFIKLESFSRQHRPAYKEFSSWPTISLDVDIAGCPFQSPKKRKSRELNQRQSTKNKNGTAVTVNSVDNSRMTRNAHGRLQQAHDDAFAVSGYCEICHTNYLDQQQHIQSERHQQFVKNSSNYLTLDTLINKGPTMDAFLKLNGANQISPVTLGSSTRRSLRSVVKLVNSTKTAEQVLAKKFTPPSNGHHFTRSSSQKQSEEKSKMLLQHKETLEVQCNGIWSHCYETRHGGMKSPISGNLARRDSWEMRTGAGVGRPQRIRRASASYCSTSLSLHQQLSPTGSDSGHHLRSRGQLWLPSNLLGTTAEDEGYPARSRVTHVSSEPQPARISRDVPGLRSSEDKVSHVSGSVKNEVRTTGRHGGNHNTSSSRDETKGCTNKNSSLGTKDEARYISGRNSISHETSVAKEEAKTNKGSGNNTGSKEDSRTSISKGAREDAKGAVNKNSVSNNTSSAESKISNHKGSSGKMSRRKRLSVEEKLIEDNKAYYKLELKNSKLRSSGYFPSQREVEFFSKVDIKEETEEEEKTEKETADGAKCNGVQPSNGPKKEKSTEETVVVRRVRKSELTLLSDEAESFMFGEPARRDASSDSSSDEEEEEEEEEERGSKMSRCTRKDTEESTDPRKNAKKNEADTAMQIKQEPVNKDRGNVLQCDESSMGSIDSCSMASSCDTNPSRQKKKRRTHAEAFIHDNLDYYKFEIPGSRLRFQGSLLPQTSTHVEEKASPNINSKTNCALPAGKKGNKSKHPKKVITIDRPSVKADIQDNHEEKTEEESKTKLKEEDANDENEGKVSDAGDNLLSSMDRLQFSFEAVPHTEPWYQTYLRQDRGHEFYSYACMSDSCYWKSFLLPYELSSSEGSGLGAGNTGSGSSSAVKKKRNKYAHLLDKKPRKSPRCHASTLAILSSLMQYRRRKEPDKLKEDWQKTPSSTSTSAEEEGSTENVSAESSPVANPGTAEPKTVPDSNLHEVSRTIDKMLSLIGDNEELSGSDTEISSDDVKQEAREMNTPLKASECKSPKTQSTNDRKRNSVKHENKKNIASIAKKVEMEVMRHKEMLEIDPIVMEELSSLPPPSAAAERVIKCRGGPKIDVVTLLDGFSTCHCLEEAHSGNKETILHPTNSHLILGESSCNSSECGASSTCETITFSDCPEGKIGFLRGKKRKRKKNRTGWPIEKQKTKKKLIEKFNKGNRNDSGAGVKATQVFRKVNLSVKNNLLTSENSADIDVRELVKDSKASLDASSAKVGQGHNVDLKSDQPLSHLRHPVGVPTRTESVEHNSLEYQPCVRVTKVSNIAEAVVLAGSSSSRDVVSNNRRLRSASLSSSSPNSSVSIQKKCFSLSAEGSSPVRKRGRPRREFSSPSSRWSTWSARKRR